MQKKSNKKFELEAIFPKGDLEAAKNFTAKSMEYTHAWNDSTYNTLIENVYF